MGSWKGEDRQAFRDIGCHPLCQTGGGLQVLLNRPGQVGVGSGAIGSVEDRADVLGDIRRHVLVRDIGLSISLQVKLAALPGDAPEDCLPGHMQTEVIVTGD